MLALGAGLDSAFELVFENRPECLGEGELRSVSEHLVETTAPSFATEGDRLEPTR